jgi:hypothetical protein
MSMSATSSPSWQEAASPHQHYVQSGNSVIQRGGGISLVLTFISPCV